MNDHGERVVRYLHKSQSGWGIDECHALFLKKIM
jgi:hypothetical protein